MCPADFTCWKIPSNGKHCHPSVFYGVSWVSLVWVWLFNNTWSKILSLPHKMECFLVTLPFRWKRLVISAPPFSGTPLHGVICYPRDQWLFMPVEIDHSMMELTQCSPGDMRQAGVGGGKQRHKRKSCSLL